jgi:hypothetical protein
MHSSTMAICFKCNLCNKIFDNIMVAELHSRSHYNGDELACDICPSKSDTMAALIKHRDVDHHRTIENDLFFCYFCEFKCNTRFQISKHILDQHQDQLSRPLQVVQPFGEVDCCFCQIKTATLPQMRNHILQQHAINMESLLSQLNTVS